MSPRLLLPVKGDEYINAILIRYSSSWRNSNADVSSQGSCLLMIIIKSNVVTIFVYIRPSPYQHRILGIRLLPQCLAAESVKEGKRIKLPTTIYVQSVALLNV